MSIRTAKKGDRVRITYETTLTRDVARGQFPIPGSLRLGLFDGVVVNVHPEQSREVTSVEILPPPEPEWQEGDVVRLGKRTYLRTSDGWWRSQTSDQVSMNDTWLNGFVGSSTPPTLLVRGGRLVTG